MIPIDVLSIYRKSKRQPEAIPFCSYHDHPSFARVQPRVRQDQVGKPDNTHEYSYLESAGSVNPLF